SATFGVSLAMMYAVKAMGILRVSTAGELKGLDLHEHGVPAYPEYALHSTAAPQGTPDFTDRAYAAERALAAKARAERAAARPWADMVAATSTATTTRAVVVAVLRALVRPRPVCGHVGRDRRPSPPCATPGTGLARAPQRHGRHDAGSGVDRRL